MKIQENCNGLIKTKAWFFSILVWSQWLYLVSHISVIPPNSFGLLAYIKMLWHELTNLTTPSWMINSGLHCNYVLLISASFTQTKLQISFAIRCVYWNVCSGKLHYTDVIMTTVASLFTSLTVVYSTLYSDADQRKHQSSASLAFVWGIL